MIMHTDKMRASFSTGKKYLFADSLIEFFWRNTTLNQLVKYIIA